MKTKEEMWDDYSQHIDSDLDSMQVFAGTCVVTQSDFYKALDEYTNQSKWISVEERLPEEKEGNFIKYIVVFSGIVTTAKYTGGNWYLSMPQEDEKLDGTDLDALTHWQPLPTAPIQSTQKHE